MSHLCHWLGDVLGLWGLWLWLLLVLLLPLPLWPLQQLWVEVLLCWWLWRLLLLLLLWWWWWWWLGRLMVTGVMACCACPCCCSSLGSLLGSCRLLHIIGSCCISSSRPHPG